MTTLTETGVSQSPHDVVGGALNQSNNALDYHALPDVDLKQSTVPLFSQDLLTVEQLVQITVDADIQASVDTFLKGLTTQMFARIVRNGSAEVGRWLGAKVQSERDGWTAMLRMAMNHIEYHRKSALQSQNVLHNALQQLLMLLDCFQLGEDVRHHVHDLQDDAQAVSSCLQLLADCCNTLMEDRFRCVDILDCGDPLPEMLSTAVQGLKDRLGLQEREKEALGKRLDASEADACRLRKQNEQFLEEMQKMEEKMRKKQEDLEGLKTQLKEIDKVVKFRKTNTADKCVGTALEIMRTKPPSHPHPPHPPLTLPASSSTTKLRSSGDLNRTWTSKEHVCTQTLREPSLIELSEEKLRILKERAKKLESSLHGAIVTMDRLRKAAPRSDYKPSSSSSSSSTAFAAAASVETAPRHRETKATPKSWMYASFQVSNAAATTTTNAATSITVPKLGHFHPAERRCFSERPTGRGDELEINLTAADKSKGESRRASRSRSNQVSKCLRCQKLFTAPDNHKLACCFHSKGKERMEVYNDDGQLVRVQYVWKCCHQHGDNDGCCFGHHV